MSAVINESLELALYLHSYKDHALSDNALSYIIDVTHRHHAESTMAMMVMMIVMSMIILNWQKDTDEDIVGVYDNANVRILSWSRMVTSPSPSWSMLGKTPPRSSDPTSWE